MTRIFLLIACGFVFPCFAASQAAAATLAHATADVNMRAGPSTVYPVVTVVPAGARIATYGCVADYSWCDVSLGNYRGWVSASYLQITYRGAPAVVTAPVAVAAGIAVVEYNRLYWDRYYAAYPWYRRWAAYPPYVAPRARVAGCGPNGCAAVRVGPRGVVTRVWRPQ